MDDQSIVTHIKGVLRRHQVIPLSSLPGRLSAISKKQRTYLKKIGIEAFLNKYPNNFAIVDDCVYPVAEATDVPPILHTNNSIIETTNRTRNISTSSSDSSKVAMPSDGAIESIKKDLEKQNSCVVCSEEIKFYAFGLCFHPICYKCSTKLRVLCNDKHCPVCRSLLSQVTFTTDLTPTHKLNSTSYIKEQKYGLSFETARIRDTYRTLLEHRCNQRNCNEKYDDFDDLKKHMQHKHGEYFCEICVKQCKIFTHDRVTYSTMELKQHEESGDSGLGSAHHGHPLCKFCDQRYLDNDELLRHLQQHHCSCHICPNTAHVYYADPYELWHHFETDHYTCTELDCHLKDRFTAFKTEDDLKLHKLRKHASKKGRSSKRVEQAIDLDINFSSRGGLQFNGGRPSSSSRSFALAPHQVSSLPAMLDGSMQCKGTVIIVTSWYGFIRPDSNSQDSFLKNIFFNKQALNLDDDDDMESHIRIGERVFVHAKPSPNYRSKWRAVNIIILEGQEPRLYTPHASEDVGGFSGYSSDISMGESLISNGIAEIDNNDLFPALSACASIQPETSTAPGGWNKVVSKKPPKVIPKPQPAPETSPSTSKQKKVKPKRQANPLEGSGEVHYHLQPMYGFLTRSNTAFEDNIYFNLLSYQTGMGKPNVKDLTKVLNINQKLFYVLEEPGKVERNTKSKYRAEKVWTVKRQQEIDSQNSGPSTLTKDPQPTKPAKAPPRQVKTEPTIKGVPSKQKVAPVTTNSGWNIVSNKHKSSNPPSPANGVSTQSAVNEHVNMSLDFFPPSSIDVQEPANENISTDKFEIFRSILGEVIGGDAEESLCEFDLELEINEIKTCHVACVHFTMNKPPKVYSVLLKCTASQLPTIRHFDLTAFQGFHRNVMNILTKNGRATKASDDFYYIKNSTIYVILRRNERGAIHELYLHTSFGGASFRA